MAMAAASASSAAAAGVLALLALAALAARGGAAVVEHTFRVGTVKMRHLCKENIITVVNGQLPGPVIEVTDGDSVVVHVINESPHGITIHWHGVRQRLNCWNDGVGMVTQCLIQPNNSYTYRFNVTGQEGTLWWHAHNSFIRATVHGALIIRPKGGAGAYPFPKPDREIPIVIGDWWMKDVVQVEREMLGGNFGNFPDAFTINGYLGDSYNCSGEPEETYELEVDAGETYLLRLTNAALYTEFFYKVAGHRFTVVAADASYVKPYATDVVVIAPGQTVDALMSAAAPPGRYYMVAKMNQPPPPNAQTPDRLTMGVVRYRTASPPSLHNVVAAPDMPDVHDKLASFNFHGGLTSPAGAATQVPLRVDDSFFITIGMGSVCTKQRCITPNDRQIRASMNNVSFVLPTAISLLEAHHYKMDGIYTPDFPRRPSRFFDFVDETLILDNANERSLEPTVEGTKVIRVKYNSTVEMVLQNTAILGTDSHPMHIHGFNFFVLAQGYGNFDAEKAWKEYNLVDPPQRNTVAVPLAGWSVIRFVADNPGMWYFHCHLELHVPVGMATAIEVENGRTPETSLPPRPEDFPRCPYNRDLMEPANGHIGYEE